jgi:catechol 2,3-dioxygenase-like lactoylglutathione lyase family enzyme
MDHLALAIGDQQRSRQFYETYCGFGALPPRRYEDGTLMLYDGHGSSLALVRADRGFQAHHGGNIVEFSWKTT